MRNAKRLQLKPSSLESTREDPEQLQPALLPGLPYEVALECMLRVPRVHHGFMKQVCRAWRDKIKERSFFEERKQRALAEEVLVLLSSCGYEDQLNCFEVDPGTGRKSLLVTYTMVNKSQVKYIAVAVNFQGFGSKILVFGFGLFTMGAKDLASNSRMLILDVIDRSVTMTPSMPRKITMRTEHAMINGKLWLKEKKGRNYDVYHLELGSWSQVQELPEEWLWTDGFAVNLHRLLGYMPHKALADEMFTEMGKFFDHGFFVTVTNQGLFMVGLSHNNEGLAVYKLHVQEGKMTTGKDWTKVWSNNDIKRSAQDVVGLKDYVVLVLLDEDVDMVMPRDHATETVLVEVSPEVKLLRVPAGTGDNVFNWSVARVLI